MLDVEETGAGRTVGVTVGAALFEDGFDAAGAGAEDWGGAGAEVSIEAGLEEEEVVLAVCSHHEVQQREVEGWDTDIS